MKHRAISDIIAVLLLLGITVAGAVLISAFFQGNNMFRVPQTNTGSQSSNIVIIGYDTRDGTDLSGLAVLDNKISASPPPQICTSSCSGANANNLPTSGGTEFIVLTVRNQGISTATIQSVAINGIEHPWNSTTYTRNFTNAKIGQDRFSVISTSNTNPQNQISNELKRNDEARLIIKLSSDISGNINASQPIRTRILTNLIDQPETIITAGAVR